MTEAFEVSRSKQGLPLSPSQARARNCAELNATLIRDGWSGRMETVT
ncbi:hypothetical protein [Nonomuraea sp. NPDC049400]